VNHSVLVHLKPEQIEVEICRADELEVHRGLSSELDEMWSYVGMKANPRWLWHKPRQHILDAYADLSRLTRGIMYKLR
jgi:hypothetical protein